MAFAVTASRQTYEVDVKAQQLFNLIKSLRF